MLYMATKAKVSGSVSGVSSNTATSSTVFSVTGSGQIDYLTFYTNTAGYQTTVTIVADGVTVFSNSTTSGSLLYWNSLGSSSNPIPANIQWKSSCTVTVTMATWGAGIYAIQYSLT